MTTHDDDTSRRQDADAHADFDASVEQFHRLERARQRRALLLALLVIGVAVSVFLSAVIFRGDLFDSGVDVAQIDQRIAAQTNDPACRAMIDRVTQLGERFSELEPTMDQKLLGGDDQALHDIREEIARMQQQLDETAEASQKANLRYDESREQLDDWFKYVATEFGFLDRLAAEQQAHLSAARQAAETEATDAPRPDDTSKTPDADADKGVVVAGGTAPTANAAKPATQTPLERKQGALVAIHDSFQKFRIWHTAGAHPCGAAPASPDEAPASAN